jgi:hypothetical protein
MNFDLPEELVAYLAELDAFIEREIKPLENENDNIRFFDHRREYERTDWEHDGIPKKEWEDLLAEARNRADAAGQRWIAALAGGDPRAPRGERVGAAQRSAERALDRQ